MGFQPMIQMSRSITLRASAPGARPNLSSVVPWCNSCHTILLLFVKPCFLRTRNGWHLKLCSTAEALSACRCSRQISILALMHLP